MMREPPYAFLSRRAVLSATAALAVGSLPAPARANPDGDHPDRGVLELYHAWCQAQREELAAAARWDDAWAAAVRVMPDVPLALRVPGGAPFKKIGEEEINRSHDRRRLFCSSPEHLEQTERSRQEMLRLWHEHEDACDRAWQAHDVPQLEREAEEARRCSDEALKALLAAPARTPLGVLLKLRVADRFERFTAEAADPDNTCVAPRAIASALRDLERLAEEEGPSCAL